MREIVAAAENPVMLYLAVKAFYPGKLPFPLLYVDTTWKFREMYEFPGRTTEQRDTDLIVHINSEGLEKKKQEGDF